MERYRKPLPTHAGGNRDRRRAGILDVRGMRSRYGAGMKAKYWWIKERHNPQLGVYYRGCGNMTVRDAMKNERPLYGSNTMHRFDNEAAYKARCFELKVKP